MSCARDGDGNGGADLPDPVDGVFVGVIVLGKVADQDPVAPAFLIALRERCRVRADLASVPDAGHRSALIQIDHGCHFFRQHMYSLLASSVCYRLPLVLRTPSIRSSFRHAISSALANALNMASAMWCPLLPDSMRICRFIPAL